MRSLWQICALTPWIVVIPLPDYAGTLAFELNPVPVPSGMPWNPSDAVAIDFNSDGNLDLVLTTLGSETYPATYFPVLALQNLGHGEFADATSNVLGTVQTVHARDLRVADFDGDGRVDLFIADHGTDISPFPGGQSLLLSQTADGKLRNDTTNSLPQVLAFTHHAAIGDVNGNLIPDIYLANIWNNTQVGPRFYINNGNSHFSTGTSLPQAVLSLQNRYTAALLVDVHGDGVLHLILGGSGGTETNDRLLLNDGHGHFTYAPLSTLPPRHWGASGETIDIASGDLDGDGWPDLLMVEELNYQQPFIQLLLNNHDGTFRDASTNILQSWPTNNSWIPFVRLVDLDGDGHLDFVCALHGGAPQIFLNDGTGRFTPANQLFPSGTPANVAAIYPGDFDGDGNPDLFVLGFNGSVWLRNLLPPRVLNYSSSRTNQAIVFPRIGIRNAAAGPVPLNATASSGLAVSYEVISGPATLTGNTVTLTGPGIATIRATQPGNDSFNPAVAVDQRMLITGLWLTDTGIVSNHFRFNVSGTASQVVVIETSTNLVNWISRQTNTLGAVPLTFTDDTPAGASRWFYRARAQ